MKFIVVIFIKKYVVEGESVIVGPKMLCPQNSGSALKDNFKILFRRGTWKLINGFLVFSK